MTTAVKKLFKHGGSFAVDLPMEFVKSSGCKEVIIESSPEIISIRPSTELDSIESEELFSNFIKGIATDAMKNPEKLRDVKDVWDSEWDNLLKGVSVDEE